MFIHKASKLLSILSLIMWTTASKLEILQASTNCTVQHWQLVQDTKLWLCNLSIVTLIELNGPLFGALSAPSTGRLAMWQWAKQGTHEMGREGTARDACHFQSIAFLGQRFSTWRTIIYHGPWPSSECVCVAMTSAAIATTVQTHTQTYTH